MSPWMAAAVGDRRDAIDTPALILDLDAFEHNLKLMMDALIGTNVRLRPHAKSHKCPEIALRQMALGAAGICCQKVSEASLFVDAGIGRPDYQSSRRPRQTGPSHEVGRSGANWRSGGPCIPPSGRPGRGGAIASRFLGCLRRSGRWGETLRRSSGAAAAVLAEQIGASSALRFAGLHCYQGGAQHMRAPEQRAQAIAAATQAALETKTSIEERGIPVEIITGAGTGTFPLERDSGVFNELQAGSYIFMDRDYADNQRAEGDVHFQHALFVLTTVMSRPTADRAIVDAGLKASSVDSGMPAVWQRDDLRYLKAADEHGVVTTPPFRLRLAWKQADAGAGPLRPDGQSV